MFAQLIQDPQKINYIENPVKPPPIDFWGQLEKLGSTFDHVDGTFGGIFTAAQLEDAVRTLGNRYMPRSRLAWVNPSASSAGRPPG